MSLAKYRVVWVDPNWQNSPLDAAQKNVLETLTNRSTNTSETPITQILPWTEEQFEEFATNELNQRWSLRTELADGTPVTTVGIVPRQYVGTSKEPKNNESSTSNTNRVTESDGKKKDEKPAVIHLYNRNYDAATKDFVPCTSLTLRFSDAIFSGKVWKTATLISPEAPDQIVTVERDTQGFRVSIPSLKLWTLVVLKP